MRAVPTIESARLVLTIPEGEASASVVDYFERNREHLAPWEPLRPEEHYTERFWQDELRRSRDEFFAGRSMRLVGVSRDDGRVVAMVNFTAFIRGAFQACLLGYSLDGASQGQGIMNEALESSIRYVFEDLGLHRVMANYQPQNARSARVLSRLGFVVEGFARNYLYIDGAWRDHVLTALTNPSWAPRR